MQCKTVRLIVMLALVILTVPLATHAQRPAKIPRIGYLALPPRATAEDEAFTQGSTEAFRQGLRDLGYVEGQNLTSAYRYADTQRNRLPDLAAELVRLPVDVLVTAGENAARAAQQATHTIPIVLAAGRDPVGSGLVASLAQPGGISRGCPS